MKFYKVTNTAGEERPTYWATRKEAHDAAKGLPALHRDEIRLDLVDMVLDKAALCSVLSSWGCAETIEKSWGLTTRGGLRPLAAGD